jgi:hypothetical protein
VPHDRDDEERKLTELGITMCRLLFKPWGRLPDEMVGALIAYCRQAADPISLMKLTPTPPSPGRVPQTHWVPETALYLKTLSALVSPIWWPELNRVQQYAFYAVFYGLSRIPFISLISAGALLYNLPLDILAKFFGGALTPSDNSQYRRWYVEGLSEANIRFPGTARISRRVRRRAEVFLRKANELEQENMNLVFHMLSNPDKNYLGPHLKDHREAYGYIVEEAPHLKISKRQGRKEREYLHRRSPDIEQKAEHLILCTECGGGIPFLYEMYKASLKEHEKSRLAPLQLHVPTYFPMAKTDGE